MSKHLDTLCLFPANQSLIVLLDAVSLAEKQQIPTGLKPLSSSSYQNVTCSFHDIVDTRLVLNNNHSLLALVRPVCELI
jgi:hypothetical protein